MKRLPPFLLFFILAVVFIGCKEEDGGPAGPKLDVPFGLDARALSDNQVLLTWQDSSYIETGFRVQRARSGTESWVTRAETGPDTTNFTDTELNEGTEYQYRVRSLGRETESELSDVVSVLTFAIAPTELVAVMDSTIFTTITLTWTDNSEKETGFLIQRKLTKRGVYEEIAEVDSGLSYLDTDLVGNQFYYYMVRAMIDSIGSLWSNEAFAETKILTPRSPSDLTATAVSSHSIRMNWQDISQNNNGFIIERSFEEDTGFELVIDLAYENLQSYTDEGLSDETEYYYRIATYNTFGNSPWSNVASATTPPGPPAAPSNLRLLDMTYQEVNITWDDNSDDETGFQLRREISGGAYIEFPTIAANLTVFSDTTVNMNTTYFYKIRTFNNSGSSGWSQPSLQVTTPDGPPRAPTLLPLETVSISEVHIIWRANRLGNHDGFYLERKSEHEGAFYQVGGEFGRNTFDYRDTDLDQNTWYSYRVFAFNDEGVSPYSNVDSTQTWNTTVFYDGFEAYTEGEIPDPPWVVTERGGSTAEIATNNPHAGEKYVHYIDTNPVPTDSAYARIVVNTRPVEKGTVSCWLKIADGGYFGVIGGEPRDYITFQAQFMADNTLWFRHGAGLAAIQGYPTDEWFQLSFIFDCRTRLYNIEINGQLRVTGAYLMRSDAEGNSALNFLTFSNAELSYADLDDVQIDDTIAADAFMQSSDLPPCDSEGELRIDDTELNEGLVR